MKFRKKSPGSSPGVPVFSGKISDTPFEVKTIRFGDGNCEKSEDSVGTIRGDSAGKYWMRVTGIHEEAKVADLAGELGVANLSIEDMLNTAHRPKVERFDGYSLLVLKAITSYRPFQFQHVAIVWSGNIVATFSNEPIDQISGIERRIRSPQSRLQKLEIEYLVWSILDVVVDHYLAAAVDMEDRLDEFESLLEKSGEQIDLPTVFQAKSDMREFRKLARPVQAIVERFQKPGQSWLPESVKPYFSDVEDHILHTVEQIELLEDRAQSVRDFFLASVSHRTNEVMQVLACVSAIFLPLTFLVGVYGMNFEFLPELSIRWAYPALWIIFVGLTVFLLLYFRRKKWM